MESPPDGDWRERLWLKRDLRRHEVLLNELIARKAEAEIRWKQVRPTARYVWRTRGDEKVRTSHRPNDGRIFSWSEPPETGHPGEDYNCRCSAEPYVSGETEFAYFTFTSPLVSDARRWGNIDFVRHYYFGRGRPVDLMEIGHLNEIARHYAYDVDGVGVFRRLSNQIADEARTSGATSRLEYTFDRTYDFGAVAFSHGGGRVEGSFSGTVDRRDAVIEITGAASFQFTDEFKDPIGQGYEVGGTPYAIRGRWEARFSARIKVDPTGSLYRVRSTANQGSP